MSDGIINTQVMRGGVIAAEVTGGGTGPKGDQGPAVVMVSNETPAGAVNGVNVVFTTMNPFLDGSTNLHINGLRQKLGVHYIESGVQQITLLDVVDDGDILTIDYISA